METLKSIFEYLDNLSKFQVFIGCAVIVNVLFLIYVHNNYKRNEKEKE